MNENLNLIEILEGCPKGTEFYCPLFGKVLFSKICSDVIYPIRTNRAPFTSDGKYLCDFNGECMLFPAKDQRDWAKFERFWDKPKVEKFNPKTLQPFDKVLVRDYHNEYWRVDIFGFIINDSICCCTTNWRCCIPYNDETKHLVGTKKDCPDYYKWWEE